jgi:sterol desaturase/sphingolipid hydroxylase (fatty acid hydroxylase superfamily)
MILLWGPSLWGLVTFDLFLNLAAQFHHGNLNIPFKLQDVMEKMIVTPRMHRCHHALHSNCINTNFSTVLSMWDRIFNTYHRVREGVEVAKIGLLKPRGPETMRLSLFLKTPFAQG